MTSDPNDISNPFFVRFYRRNRHSAVKRGENDHRRRAPRFRAQAEKLARDADVPVRVLPGTAQALPLDDESVDAELASLVLCTVPDEAAALAEARRVIRPGGELRFYEHVHADRQPLRALLEIFAAVAISATVLIAACGDSAPTFTPSEDPVGQGGPQHIHGLGINPADDALMIATHSGLFRAAPGSATAKRVGDRRQDTMGFTVVGPDRFLGSGHPDLRDDLPPLLGLIRSDDAGRSWKPVSLLGQADFHVLRTAGTRVYGVNASDGRVLVSDDGGRRWAAHTPPSGLLDLAASPSDPDRLVASGETGLFASRDAGATWRPLDEERVGLLTWLRDGRLVLVDGGGTVQRSSDAGASWRKVGEIGGRPAAFAAHGGDLYVALHSNEVKVSTDGGRTWRTRVAP